MALYVRQDQDTAKQVTAIYKGSTKIISAVYQGVKLLWQYIKSCFGRGYWINDKMWSNRDGWAN